ncbi:unnamed protein product, partial [Amoebophrya sp. A25]
STTSSSTSSSTVTSTTSSSTTTATSTTSSTTTTSPAFEGGTLNSELYLDVSQSSTSGGHVAWMPLAYRTTGGTTRDLTGTGTCCLTNDDGGDTNFRNWWRAAFPSGVTRYVSEVTLWNRGDCCTDKLDNARIMYDDYLGNAVSTQISGSDIDQSIDLSGASSIGTIAGDAIGTTIQVRRKINALTLFTKFDDTNGGVLTLCGIHVIGTKAFQTTTINDGFFETVYQSSTKHYEGFPYLPLLYRSAAEDS